MSREVNKYGLSREFSAECARIVRRECGFGCVICGNGFYQYEHIDPPFAEAKEHDPGAMALLCGSHHDAVTRGRLSKETVKEARQAPWCRTKGRAWADMDVPRNDLRIGFGNAFFCEPRTVLVMLGKEMLRVEEPEESGAPLLISGCFYDADGRLVVEIVRNQLVLLEQPWDVELIGDSVTVRRGPGDIALVMRTMPRRGLKVERINMSYRGARIWTKDGVFIAESPSGATFEVNQGMAFVDCECCIDIEEDRIQCGSRVPPHEAVTLPKLEGPRASLQSLVCRGWVTWKPRK